VACALTASFLLRDAPDVTAPSLPTYRGRPVQTDTSLLRRPLTASLRRAVEYVDNGFGPIVVESVRDVFERGETLTLTGSVVPAPPPGCAADPSFRCGCEPA